jgi:laminin alpha 1/2
MAQKVAAMFENRAGRLTVEQALQAANAYRGIMAAMEEARAASLNALDVALLAAKVADPPAGREKNLGRHAETSRQRSEDLRQEAQGLWKNADDMGILTRSIKLDVEKFVFDLEKKERLSAELYAELKRQSFVSEYATAARQAASKALNTSGVANMKTDTMVEKIKLELRGKVNELNSFSAEELGQIPRRITEAQRTLQKVEKQAVYMEHRSRDLTELNDEVTARLSTLRSRINMARHAASNIHISITGGEGGACLRSYAVELTSSTHNEISLIFGIDVEDRDAMLVFLPGGSRRGSPDGGSGGGDFDFLALEMVDRKIRFVWNLGSGTQAITHNVEIETAYRLDRQDTMWYKITAERIGNIGRLNVRKVRPKYDLPAYHQWVVGESPATTNVLDVGPGDRLWVGGTPNYYKTDDLLSTAGSQFHGVLYQLTVDKQRVGLWDFATSFGCRETYSGVTDAVSQHSCHSFNGDGYATQNQIRNYDPRYYAVSLEFRTFDLNALLVLVANHGNGQYLALQLVDGRVSFQIQYAKNVTLNFVSRNTYNSGQWVKIEAGRAYRKVSNSSFLVHLKNLNISIMDINYF